MGIPLTQLPVDGTARRWISRACLAESRRAVTGWTARPVWIAYAVLLGTAVGHPFATGAEIEFVTVGDPGNKPIVVEVKPDGTQVALGAVGHPFRIGKHELTRVQWLEFLNTVDPTGANTRKLWNETHAALVGILRDSAAPAGKKYRLDNPANAKFPVKVPSWYAAARYCNWLHNGKGASSSTEGDAAAAAYDTRFFDDSDVRNDPVGRNPGAKYWIPSENEWIKAGHYKGGGTNAGYWTYPTRSDGYPAAGFPPGGTNSANINSFATPVPGGPIPVGSYPNSFSPYGTYDMAGNEHEWTETWFEGDAKTPPYTRRMTRGGSYSWMPDHTEITYRLGTHRSAPASFLYTFRPAALPVPENTPPTIGSGPSATPNPSGMGQTVSFSVVSSDADGDPLSYAWTFGDGSASSPQAGGTATHAYVAAGTYTAVVTVTDGQGGSVSGAIAVTVADTAGPVLEVSTIVLKGNVSDVGGVTGLKVDGVAVTINTDGSWQKEVTVSGATTTFTLTATDASGNSTNKSLTVMK